MTYVPEKVYEIPSEGQHVTILTDEIDLGEVPNTFEPGKTKHINKLIFAVDEVGTDGKPLQVQAFVNLVRSKGGTLIKYIRALSHPAPVTRDSWDTSQYIGRCCGLNIVHAEKPEGTYANVDHVYPLPKGAPKLSIPSGYVRQADRNASFPGNQSKPAQAARASGTNGGTPAAAGNAGTSTTRVHGVDITDADVDFPGDIAST